MRRILKFSLIFITIVLIIIGLTGCNNANDKKTIEQKINTEISYIDSELISIINELNNINYAKYRVEVQEVQNASRNAEEAQNKNGSSKQASEEKNAKESGKEGEGSNSNSEEQNTSESSSQVGENENSENKIFSMKSNNILGKEANINWDELREKIEKLYTAWTTVSIDLRDIGVSTELLNEFANNMDMLAVAIKDEDITRTMDGVIRLYDFLPKFVDVYGANKEKNVLVSKYKLLYCYRFAVLEDWEQLQEAVSDLKMSFSNILNKKNEYKGKESNIDGAGVIINEIGNSSEVREKDVFFIKYKNLMQELNVILAI